MVFVIGPLQQINILLRLGANTFHRKPSPKTPKPFLAATGMKGLTLNSLMLKASFGNCRLER